MEMSKTFCAERVPNTLSSPFLLVYAIAKETSTHRPCFVMIISVWYLWNLAQRG